MPLSPDEETLFWERISKRGHGGCWLWTGAVDRYGYGALKLRGRTLRAHRVALTIAEGGYPKQPVLHLCGERLCCNPRHLKQGSLRENVEHMRVHGTLATGARNGAVRHPEALARGEEVASSRLSAAQVRRIRRLYENGDATMSALARQFGVNKSTISRVINGVHWAHL